MIERHNPKIDKLRGRFTTLNFRKFKDKNQVEKDEGRKAEALPRLLIVVEGPY